MAAVQQCIAVKSDGEVCGKQCRGNANRCGVHLRTLETNGPNALARKELDYRHKKVIRDTELRYIQLLAVAGEDFNQRRRLLEDEHNELSQLRVIQRRGMTLLIRHQDEEILRTGFDPDQAARERNRQRLLQRDREMAERRAEFNNRLFDDREVQDAANLLNRAAALIARNNDQGELGRFARDPQNVHTTPVVQQTKDIVDRILKIPVPAEYKWNMTVCSKTPGEIITMCKLTPKGAWQMSAKYCQDENIYEMGKGIYGKVLDGVWQYILNSPDKVDLCRILRQEMEDNIGMCAQGNLTRLCNILAGYMEGIGSQESIADILGRLLPKLMEIEDVDSRLAEAFRVLKENNLPYTQWKTWLDPLLSDQDVETTVDFLYNEQREITGIVTIIH